MRPIQPSISLGLAQALAVADPRCDSIHHNQLGTVRHFICPTCLLSLDDYLQLIPRHWPEPGLVSHG